MKIAVRILLLALLAHARVAAAVNCRLSVTPFVFGSYLPGDLAPLDVTGQVDLRCSGSAGPFVVTLAPGGSGTFVQRLMISGPYQLAYNFYLNPARTTVWGDGTGGTGTVNGFKSQPAPGRQDFVFPVYGRVFPMQNVGAGAYSDNVLVTVIF